MEHEEFTITTITTDMYTGDVFGETKELINYTWVNAIKYFMNYITHKKEEYKNETLKIRVEISLSFKDSSAHDSIMTEIFYSDNLK